MRHDDGRPTTNEPALSEAAIRACLDARWMGRDLRCFAVLDSTNTTARELALGGAPEGTVVIAEAQRRGRGRLGRSWVSPAVKNLYLSVVLRSALPAGHVSQISLLAGVATCETVAEWCAAAIKWPNDVLVDGRKVAGILAELEGIGGARVVVLGIGVNLNSDTEDFPEELRDKATSLRLATGAPVDRARFTGRLLTRLEARCDQLRREGFAPIAGAWRAHASLIGKTIRVQEPGAVVEGIAVDIDDDGALRLRLPDGHEHRVVAGDVTVIGGYEPSV